MKWSILLVMALVLALVATSALAMTCYQEDNLVPNQTGLDTQNCGLNYSGSINISTNPPTQGIVGIIDYVWIKPPHAQTTSQFKYKVGEIGEQTNFIPSDCYNYDPTALHYRLTSQVQIAGAGGEVVVSCYNGTGYPVFYQNSCSGTALPASGNPADVNDGNWSTYAWYESYPPSIWLKYPAYSQDNSSVDCALWEIAMDWNVCIPDWSCSGYGFCNTTNQEACVLVNDTNNCGDTYTGDYSEFASQTCDYCTPDFHCTSLTSCFQFDMERHCNGLQYVADRNNCYPQTNLTSDQFNGSLSIFDTSNCSEYSPVYSTTDMGKMLVDLLGNIAVSVLGLIGFAVIILLSLWGVKKIRGEIK